jgi:hypothetical protein
VIARTRSVFAIVSPLTLLGCGARSSLDAIYAHGLPDAAPRGQDSALPGSDSAAPGRDAAPDAVDAGRAGCPSDSGTLPVVLASGLDMPDGIAIDEAFVYWVENGSGSVKRVSICGGAVTTLATGQSAPTAIAVDATSVYWINYPETEQGGSIMRVAKGGGAAPEVLASALGGVDCIAVGSSAVYGATGIGAVTRISLEGGAPTVVVPGDILVSGLAVDTTRAYWISEKGGVLGGILFSAPLTSGTGTPTMLASGLNNARSLVLGATVLYWIEFDTAYVPNVVRMPAGGGTPELVASNAVAFAIDGADVFWIRSSSLPPVMDDILEGSLDGGAPTVLAAGQSSPNAIAVNSSGVYWSESGPTAGDAGAIVKLAR